MDLKQIGDSSGNSVFDASQYAFFGNNVVEEVELGGLEGEEEEIPVGGLEEDFTFDKEEAEISRTLSDADDLASTFSKDRGFFSSRNLKEFTMKRGGTKRKIPIEKRETKEQRSVTCNKRRKTIFSKSADLCRRAGADIAVFVTSPAENSDVVYSFSGYSPASEIADCYFNGKPPPMKINPHAKLGFLWDDPDLYRNCDNLSELNIIEDRLERLKKNIMKCLEKKENQ